jgi:two-component system, sensor histidine kinase and response regulator
MTLEESINILVVDDNPENLKIVSNFLKESGYQIALALDADSTLMILKANKIDLILLDIMMPGVDGFQLCKIIKDDPELTGIPVIFLTAKTETDDVVRGFQLGGVDYITKPFKKEELLVRVRNHIQLKLMRDFLQSEMERQKTERNQWMKMLLEFSKVSQPHNKKQK